MPMVQLCSGQATLVPNTMPCDSGPPLCGQRSSRANTWSWSLRNTATSTPWGRFTLREPSTGISVTRQIFFHSLMYCSSGAQRRELARVDRGLVVFEPGIGLALQGGLQAGPKGLAQLVVFQDLLLDVVQAHTADVVHRALQVPAFLAVQLHEGARVLQHFLGSLELGEEVRDLGLDAAVAGDVHL